MKFNFLVLFISFSAMANPGYISDFDYQLTDIAQKGLKKEVLFSRMERGILNLEDAICANKAHVWGYDFSRFYGINTGKIFVFFGSSLWKEDKKGWMYHVAPYIIENGEEWVMDANYGDVIKPLNIDDWVANETYNRVRGSECEEIFAQDTDLTNYFYERFNLPENRGPGKKSARCYIRKVPGYYWFPTSIAYHDLKKDEDGDKIDYNPKGFDFDDVMSACEEAVSSKLGRFFGGNKGKCKKYFKR